MAELTKLLKDHNTFPKMISKEQLAALIRVVNTKICNRYDLSAMDYDGFLVFIV